MYELSDTINTKIEVNEDDENYLINIFKNYDENNLPVDELRSKFKQLQLVDGNFDKTDITLLVRTYQDDTISASSRFNISNEIEQLTSYNMENLPVRQVMVSTIRADWSISDYKDLHFGAFR